MEDIEFALKRNFSNPLDFFNKLSKKKEFFIILIMWEDCLVTKDNNDELKFKNFDGKNEVLLNSIEKVLKSNLCLGMYIFSKRDDLSISNFEYEIDSLGLTDKIKLSKLDNDTENINKIDDDLKDKISIKDNLIVYKSVNFWTPIDYIINQNYSKLLSNYLDFVIVLGSIGDFINIYCSDKIIYIPKLYIYTLQSKDDTERLLRNLSNKNKVNNLEDMIKMINHSDVNIAHLINSLITDYKNKKEKSDFPDELFNEGIMK
jgi:hypothetical protein